MQNTILSVKYSELDGGFSRHYHDCHQIIYIVKGSASIRINKEERIARAGETVIISHLEEHSVTPLSDSYQRYVLRISPILPLDDEEDYRIFSPLFNRPSGFANVFGTQKRSDVFEGILKRMLIEYESDKPLGSTMLSLYLKELLIELCRCNGVTDELDFTESLEVIADIQREFEENFSLSFSLSELAKKYGISVSYLSHTFKKTTGSSVMGYLLSCRIAAAKKYLAKTGMSISDVAEDCGFSDLSNFSRTFKAVTGYSPREFRAIYK